MLDYVTGSPRPLRLGNSEFLVGALKLLEEGHLVGYLRANVPKPLKALREIIDMIPEAEKRQALKDATWEENHAWPPSPSSMEGQRIFLSTPEGQRFFLGVALRKHQPGLSDTDLDRVMGEINEEDLLTLFAVAFGEDPDPESARARVQARIQAMRDRLNQISALLAPDVSPSSSPGESSSPTSPSTRRTGRSRKRRSTRASSSG